MGVPQVDRLPETTRCKNKTDNIYQIYFSLRKQAPACRHVLDDGVVSNFCLQKLKHICILKYKPNFLIFPMWNQASRTNTARCRIRCAIECPLLSINLETAMADRRFCWRHANAFSRLDGCMEGTKCVEPQSLQQGKSVCFWSTMGNQASCCRTRSLEWTGQRPSQRCSKIPEKSGKKHGKKDDQVLLTICKHQKYQQLIEGHCVWWSCLHGILKVNYLIVDFNFKVIQRYSDTNFQMIQVIQISKRHACAMLKGFSEDALLASRNLQWFSVETTGEGCKAQLKKFRSSHVSAKSVDAPEMQKKHLWIYHEQYTTMNPWHIFQTRGKRFDSSGSRTFGSKFRHLELGIQADSAQQMAWASCIRMSSWNIDAPMPCQNKNSRPSGVHLCSSIGSWHPKIGIYRNAHANFKHTTERHPFGRSKL